MCAPVCVGSNNFSHLFSLLLMSECLRILESQGICTTGLAFNQFLCKLMPFLLQKTLSANQRLSLSLWAKKEDLPR